MKQPPFKPAVILFAVFLFICMHQLQAQDKFDLITGKPVSTSIKQGEKHQYTVNLKAEQFAFFKLVQKGIDLIITTYDPEGNKIEDFDSPNGKNGPELITIITGKKGSYRLEVRPLNEEETGGNYDLSIEKTEPKGTTPDKQVDQLFAAWNNPNTPGAAVAVVKEGTIILKKGYGSANLEYAIPITPSTIFHIASVSKQFTTFSILLLAQEGKLSLDDDIRKYIPEVPDFGKVITLRQLAHHTSGLRDQWNLLAMAGWRLDDVITKEHVLKLVSKQQDLNFNPGEEFLYCNTGFTLLAEVVARLSGQTFAAYTQEHIFTPLKMSNTLFYDDHEKIVKNRAYSFYQNGGEYKKSVLSYANVGATSLFTTVEDLSRWAMNFETPVVGNKEIISQMNERGILNNGDTLSYALGQDNGVYKGLTYIAHGGADAGYRTFLIRLPDQKFSVVVLSNDASFNPGGLAFKIIDIYLKDKLVEDTKKVDDAPKNDTAAVSVNIAMLTSYCGKYEMQPGMVVTITHEDNKLYGEAPGATKILLVPVSDSEFKVPGMDAMLTFQKEDGKVTKLLIKMNGQEMIASRIKDFDSAAVNLTELTGNYYSPELSTTYSFVIDSGKLIARHPRLSDFELKPVKPDFFTTDQWFFGQVEFVRDANKQITGCKVSSGRVRNLKFERVE